MMSIIQQFFIRREPWLYLTTIVGVASIVSFWFPFAPLPSLYTEIMRMSSVISFFMLCLGALTQYMIHIPTITQQKKGWGMSAFFLGELTLFIVLVISTGSGQPISNWLVLYLRTPLSLGAGALQAPFVYRALLRSVNVKSISVTIMVAIIILTMAGGAPILYSNFMPLYNLADFISTRLVSGPSAAFSLIIALVSGGTCLRMLLGQERGYLGK